VLELRGGLPIGREALWSSEPRHQEATTDDDSSINEQADGPNAAHVAEAAGSSKCLARSPMDHFESLLEEVCPNHAYAVKHKL
jgi:hypothetical protein